MRRPRFLSRSQRGAPSAAGSAPPFDQQRRAERRAIAVEHGWGFAPEHQRAIQGWPRTALPPGPLGRVHNEVTGRHQRRPFRMFDYVHRSGTDGQWQILPVWTVALPAHMPYLEITENDGGSDIYAESPEPHFALELLSEAVSAAISRHGFRRIIIDENELICTGADGGPEGIEAKLTALNDVVDQVPVAAWARWAR
ncbi:hypothetical protein CLV63_10945 [Murinocardiopsis flavida]|uniref:Uncharacterized protein n=1 Tax=Murinocardiopsis flavida TaxID=645275 RepID=A0A2P8DIJ2_9ACTN|nr:hypothetical protein [Murinocardiopsis flavida]PSK97042.1 hypothetical protein CLV63_10945 [Murinocardiopsis flavida]